jgi:Tfp pilus assembly protein PilF
MCSSRTPQGPIQDLKENSQPYSLVINFFQFGVEAHRAGRLDEAEEAYRQTLARDNEHVEALYMLAILHQQKGNLNEAVSLIRRALALKPDIPDAHYNLGVLLQATNHPLEAEVAYRSALKLSPDSANAYNNLGALLVKAERRQEAEEAYRHALTIQPNFFSTQQNLALLLQETYRTSEAETLYRRSLELRPDSADACNNLGSLLREMERPLEAETWFRRALVLRPGCAVANNNLGVMFKESQRWQEAEDAWRCALSVRPDFVEAQQSLALLLQETNRATEAETIYRRTLEIAPDDPDIHYNYACLLLQAGEFARGWQEFEYRWKTKGNGSPWQLAQPFWRGDSELNGKSIMLTGEQGLGDTLQFVRYAPLLAARGATVYLAVQPSLKSLTASCPGVAEVFAFGDALPPSDYQCPLMSLPLICNTVLETIPAEIPYLTGSPANIARWREKLGRKTALRVGLTWAGNPRKNRPESRAFDRGRSIHFDQLRPLLAVPGVEFFSLQLGQEAAGQLNDTSPVIDFTAELLDYQETAALVANLDLVISVDTSVAHMTGAIGKPLWLLNRYNTCWRWLADRDDSPWYPTARIFRQPSLGDWDNVISNVKRALEERVSSSVA